jgi:hypothetical protein
MSKSRAYRFLRWPKNIEDFVDAVGDSKEATIDIVEKIKYEPGGGSFAPAAKKAIHTIRLSTTDNRFRLNAYRCFNNNPPDWMITNKETSDQYNKYWEQIISNRDRIIRSLRRYGIKVTDIHEYPGRYSHYAPGNTEDKKEPAEIEVIEVPATRKPKQEVPTEEPQTGLVNPWEVNIPKIDEK